MVCPKLRIKIAGKWKIKFCRLLPSVLSMTEGYVTGLWVMLSLW